jgi:hypothetical protein
MWGRVSHIDTSPHVLVTPMWSEHVTFWLGERYRCTIPAPTQGRIFSLHWLLQPGGSKENIAIASEHRADVLCVCWPCSYVAWVSVSLPRCTSCSYQPSRLWKEHESLPAYEEVWYLLLIAFLILWPWSWRQHVLIWLTFSRLCGYICVTFI